MIVEAVARATEGSWKSICKELKLSKVNFVEAGWCR